MQNIRSFAETAFNFSVLCAITQIGKIVLVDIGEIP